MKPADLPIVFISYMEDNADMNYSDLLKHVPWASRVHGVKGSDACHKAAANVAKDFKDGTATHFVGIDGDNIVDPSFWDIELPELTPNTVLSYSSRNHINGLEYGNGGIKIWPIQYVLDMKSHEIADNPKESIDFCWEEGYEQVDKVYSTNIQSATPRQAFRAGFREGVKLSLNRGLKVDPNDFENSVWWGNYHRLLIWCNVGADIDNGLWAIYGARLGCVMTNFDKEWDYTMVRDFDYIENVFEEQCAQLNKIADGDKDEFCMSTGLEYSKTVLIEECENLGKNMKRLLDMEIVLSPTPEQSVFFKKVYQNFGRQG